MVDHLSKKARSALMSRIRGKDTKPERIVRQLAYQMGYRFRLHRKDLPGTPDLVFPSRKKVVFVNGCFWHMHDCGRAAPPKTETDYWIAKLERNRHRDEESISKLIELGWKVLVVWECQTRDLNVLAERLKSFLD